MGQKTQHFKSLMKKNWINWKRSKVSSICELICPIALMAILAIARVAVQKQYYSESSQIQYSSMYHPVQPLNITALQNLYASIQASPDLSKFNYSALSPIDYQKYADFYNFSQLQMLNNSPSLTFLAPACQQTKQDAARPLIAFAPNNSLTRQVIQELQNHISIQTLFSSLLANSSKDNQTSTFLPQKYNKFQYKAFNTSDELLSYLSDPLYMMDDLHPGICFGFDISQNQTNKFQANLYFNDQKISQSQQSIPSQILTPYSNLTTAQDNASYFQYEFNGFSLLQNLISNVILKNAVKNPDASIAMAAVPFLTPAYIADQFGRIISAMLPFFMLLVYILPIRRMLQRIVTEKELRIRESMRMMGLVDFSYWLSWFVYYAIMVTAISIICLIILSINAVKYSNKFLLFLYLWIYGISQFGFIVFIQCFFSNQRVAQIGGTLIYFGSSFIDQAVLDPNTAQSSKLWASLLSTVAVTRGATVMGAYEVSNVGISFNNVNEIYQNYSFAWCLIMMSISFGMFLIIGLYLDNVLPSAYGRRKPFYFCISPSYWRGYRRQRNNTQRRQLMNDKESQKQFDLDFELKYLKRENYEAPAQELHQQEEKDLILKISDLKKKFSNGFEAVKGVNVKMYNGQIFALLGHNGAGKTTTISILTGLIEQTFGSAEVYGYDLFNDMQQVRTFLGVCPQHDILFDLLTPLEHLQIFCDFKGVRSNIKDAECQKMLQECDLMNCKDTIAAQLSGGNRRKLSVAIALVGGSRLVMLDEPTSGMDLTARRRLWNMLKAQKSNRIIILTTHYMDEADILGDRIGIMAEGKLICLGSALFLKNRFGIGYILNMTKTYKDRNFKIERYLKERLGSEIKKLSEVSSEITFQIPKSYSEKFEKFFEEFDRSLNSLDIKGYGISVTTLEEVFLKVGHGEELEEQNIQEDQQILAGKNEEAKLVEFDDEYSVAVQHETGCLNVFNTHLYALFRKRFFMYRRSYKTFIVEVFIPLILIICGFALTKIQFFYQSPNRNLIPNGFPQKQKLLFNSDLLKRSPYDITPQQLSSSLPDFYSSFIATFNNYTQLYQNTSNMSSVIYKFDTDIYAQESNLEKPYNYGSYFAFQANNLTKQFQVSSFLNLTAQDVTAYFPTFMYQSILKQATGDPEFDLTFTTMPYPISQKIKNRSAAQNGLFISFIIAISFALIPASIISFIINEREKNLKHMQIISGMNLSAYWISNYTFDILKAEITMGLTIGLIYAFGLTLDGTWPVFLMYPVGLIPFTYATSFIFKNEGVGQTFTIFLHFVIAGIGSMVVYILRVIETTYAIGDALLWVFKIVPSFCINYSIVYSSGKGQIQALRPEFSTDDYNIVNMGGDLLILGMHFIFWTTLLIIIESGGCNCLRNYTCRKKDVLNIKNSQYIEDYEKDEDVIQEEKRIEETPASQMNIRVNNFRKVYTTLMGNPFLAVDKVSFGLDYGECFCLIGVNGAGKTTTFKSLTNDIIPSSGEISINGMDINKDFNYVRKLIGYCPQYDVIFENMTVEQHLDYYGRIKGILADRRQELIEQKIIDLNLSDHRKKTATTLSGGNKRKLSVAISLLGNPPIIFLDEPSAGMDPQARRFMWQIISKVSKLQKKSAVILTTHSMEEVEALSDKLGIMVRGGIFRCFGSCQQIKDKFGTGYEIEIKFRRLNEKDYIGMSKFYDISENEEKVSFANCAQIMRDKKVNEFLVQELKQNGLGNDLFQEALSSKGFIVVKHFLSWLHVQINAQKVINNLLADFKHIEILEYYNDYIKLKMQKMDKSIGYLFGAIEQQKERHQISEYSVSQTTLEQIFQRFANVDDVDAVKGMVFELNEAENKVVIRQPFKKQSTINIKQ